MSGNGPTWPGQGDQQNPAGGLPPVEPPPLPPLPWEQPGAAPAAGAPGPGADGTPPGSSTPPQPGFPPANGAPAAPPYGQPAPPHQESPPPPYTQAQPMAPGGYAGQGGQPQAGYGATQPYEPYAGASGSPAPQRPGRRGMPAWAWWTIGVGAVVVIGAVVAVSLVINLIMPMTADGPDGGTAGGGTSEPDGDGDGGAADYPLTASVDADLAGFWDTPDLGPEWTVTDEDEAYLFAEHAGGCAFEAQAMNLVGHDPSATDDAAASEADFSAFFDEIAEGTEIADQSYEAASSVLVDSAGGSIEFAAYDTQLTWNDGARTIERWYWRSFIEAEASMYGYLSCPSGSFTQSQMEESIGALTVE